MGADGIYQEVSTRCAIHDSGKGTRGKTNAGKEILELGKVRNWKDM
jgi:hypothetical protein